MKMEGNWALEDAVYSEKELTDTRTQLYTPNKTISVPLHQLCVIIKTKLKFWCFFLICSIYMCSGYC